MRWQYEVPLLKYGCLFIMLHAHYNADQSGTHLHSQSLNVALEIYSGDFTIWCMYLCVCTLVSDKVRDKSLLTINNMCAADVQTCQNLAWVGAPRETKSCFLRVKSSIFHQCELHMKFLIYLSRLIYVYLTEQRVREQPLTTRHNCRDESSL